MSAVDSSRWKSPHAVTVWRERDSVFWRTLFTRHPHSSAKLGNYHCNNRVYSIQAGRWLSPDQAKSPSWNLFGYASNQSVFLTDPTGLADEITDENVEDNYKLKGALKGGTLKKDDQAADAWPREALHGRTFSDACIGGPCNLSFTFDKAHYGSWDSGTKDGKYVGMYTKISATTDCCCKELKIMQIGRYSSGGHLRNERTPDDKARSRRATKKTETSEGGWFVDTNSLTPYYSVSNSGKSGCEGAKAAVAWDTPAEIDKVRKEGDGKHFMTCIVCDGKLLGCVHWGYYVDKNGNVKVDGGGVSCGAPEQVADALKTWNEVAGIGEDKELQKHSIGERK